MKATVDENVTELKNRIAKLADDQKFEEVLSLIRTIAYIEYKYNQRYIDDYLEEMLKTIPHKKRVDEELDDRTVVFYDNFGLELRGLSYIYLNALGHLGYKIIYVVASHREWNAPLTKKLLDSFYAKIICIKRFPLMESKDLIERILYESKARYAFLYTTPWDTAGICAFMNAPKGCIRYQINLTDHAFWLGKNAFDYCIEFREYGALISIYERQISPEKLLVQPYYPAVIDCEFQGYPFNKSPDATVMFSGGGLYKTLDADNTYYQIVDECLRLHNNLVFWYAGTGEDRYLKEIEIKYPGRVFMTNERKDLFQIMQHIDIYLNTYPIIGGLMTQYAALAGKLPMTLSRDDISKGVLFEKAEKEVYYSDLKEFMEEMHRLLEDNLYRSNKEKIIDKNCIISSEEFASNLEMIVKKNKSRYVFSVGKKVNTDNLHNVYLSNYSVKKMCDDIREIGHNDFLKLNYSA